MPHPFSIASYNMNFIIICLLILRFFLIMKSMQSHNRFSCPKYFMHGSLGSSLTVYPFIHSINIIVTNIDKPCAIITKFMKKIL